MLRQIAIIGGGQAAAQAVQSLRQSGFDGRIRLIADEPALPYQRPPLSKKFLAGELEAERLLLKPEAFYQQREIELFLGRAVRQVDLGAGELRLDDGERLSFEALLFATGGRPRRLELPGADLAGVHYLRTIADVERLRPAFRPGTRLLIVGAGYIGLEVAAVAATHGLEVTVLETADRVMARSVCPAVSDFYADRHRRAGVDLRTGTGLARLVGHETVTAAETAAGERIDCELVLVGIGIVPNTALAADAGLTIDNGIAVDACARASAAGVFAAGDCASHPHPLAAGRIRLESVHNAIEQGKAAAAAMAGREEPFTAVPWFWSDQYELKLQIAGLSQGFDETVVRGRPDEGSFAVFYLRAGEVIAVDAVNAPREFMLARQRLADRPRWPAAAIADRGTDLAALPAGG